ncbi:hypothetical protein [Hymenobacter guriensis]|uniref:Cache 3/Cache 2 fusion domain-containing protein n=1 Tax=Hymenobacter guriensis TaxID=2793065 RepID=A0ABS0L742_9BACT|nr:hypothetical protein [Hymenobacter guriensis]MBG8555961.1 hypothetical protein [Hymenobacter guriensis]
MQTELHSLQRQVTWLKGYALTSSLLMLAFILFSLTTANKSVIRAQGIVIEDAQGRDRILIGAPIPASRSRVRTNLQRVAKEWAPKLGGKKYMDWYAGYDHSANGIVFLNEQGFDKVVVGETMPDPNTGRRQVRSAGMTFNDDQGFERGGVGVSVTAEGKTRGAFGLDDEQGEAIHMFVLEDGTRGLRVGHDDGYLFLGKAVPHSMIAGSDKAMTGALAVDRTGQVIWQQSMLAQSSQPHSTPR